MFKEVITHMSLGDLSTAGLLLFVFVFLAVAFYAITRSPSQTEQWARIPLSGDRDTVSNDEEGPLP
jgi:hypothetical protein